jgi:NADPH2:quinone reductase
MKAVVIERPAATSGTTVVRDTPAPTARPGQTLIDVDHAGLNFIDVMARRGDPGYASAWPFVPGLEVAGTVAAVADPASPLRVGQRVAALTPDGGLAEQVLADDALVVPLPDGVDPALAAAAPLMLSTALLLLRDAARFAPGDTVLMHSVGGGVGNAVARLVPVLGGGRLIGTVGAPGKVGVAEAAGWEHVVVRDGLLADRVSQIAPAGADVVLDPLGTRMLDSDLTHAAPGARVVLFGNPGADALAGLPPVGRLIGGNLSVGGFSISRLSRTAPRRVAGALRDVLDLLATGRLDLPVTLVDGLEHVGDTHDVLARGGSTGKYVVRVA